MANKSLAVTVWEDIPSWLRPWLASAIFTAALGALLRIAVTGGHPITVALGG